MLRPGAQAGDHEEGEKRGEPRRRAEAEEADGREERSDGQDARLTAALGQEARRDLEEREGAGVGGAEQADLRKGKGEFPRPHGEERVEEAGAAVVQEVDGTARSQGGPSAAGVHGA